MYAISHCILYLIYIYIYIYIIFNKFEQIVAALKYFENFDHIRKLGKIRKIMKFLLNITLDFMFNLKFSIFLIYKFISMLCIENLDIKKQFQKIFTSLSKPELWDWRIISVNCAYKYQHTFLHFRISHYSSILEWKYFLRHFFSCMFGI